MAKKAEKTTYVMSKVWNPMMETMPREKLGDLMYAILRYQDGEIIEIEDPMTAAMFNMCKTFFDKNEAAYKEQCEINAKIAQERETKKKDEPSRTVTTRHEPSRTITDNDNDSDIDIDYDSDSEDGFENDKESLRDIKTSPRAYSNDPRVDLAIQDFLAYRKREKKKPMGDIAISRFLSKLGSISLDPDIQIQAINTAIENGWLTVYPPKEEARSGTPPDKYTLIDAWARGEV